MWDTLGTNLQNITKDISKWTIDKEGTQQRFHGRNKDQRKIAHETHDENALHDISEANGGELHSTDLTPDTISNFLNDQKPSLFNNLRVKTWNFKMSIKITYFYAVFRP